MNQLTTDTPLFELVLGATQLRAHVTIFAEALVFAADGKVETHYGVKPIETSTGYPIVCGEARSITGLS